VCDRVVKEVASDKILEIRHSDDHAVLQKFQEVKNVMDIEMGFSGQRGGEARFMLVGLSLCRSPSSSWA
jgi:hypothetical protein